MNKREVSPPKQGVSHLNFSRPRLSWRFTAVWRRNFLVWKKLWLPSLLGNLADPLIYMLGLGYGLGSLLPQIGGTSYIAYLAAGSVCFSSMNSASFEALYSAFSRMHVQKSWEAILNAPMSLDDIVFAEAVWAASKSCLSGLAIMLVALALGLVQPTGLILWILPIVFLAGLAFASMGLIATALAPGYDFFMFYFTLLITPMALVSGVFFPPEQLPAAVQTVAAVLPLSHVIAMVRPLLFGQLPHDVLLHVVVLVAYAVAGFWIALALARRRLLR